MAGVKAGQWIAPAEHGPVGREQAGPLALARAGDEAVGGVRLKARQGVGAQGDAASERELQQAGLPQVVAPGLRRMRQGGGVRRFVTLVMPLVAQGCSLVRRPLLDSTAISRALDGNG